MKELAHFQSDGNPGMTHPRLPYCLIHEVGGEGREFLFTTNKDDLYPWCNGKLSVAGRTKLTAVITPKPLKIIEIQELLRKFLGIPVSIEIAKVL